MNVDSTCVALLWFSDYVHPSIFVINKVTFYFKLNWSPSGAVISWKTLRVSNLLETWTVSRRTQGDMEALLVPACGPVLESQNTITFNLGFSLVWTLPPG
jgi:hypothetical protein